MIAVATNAPRQSPKRANIPPTSGPIRTDMLQLPDIKAMVRDQAASGNVRAHHDIGHGHLQAAAEALDQPAGDDPAHRRRERAKQRAEAERRHPRQ